MAARKASRDPFFDYLYQFFTEYLPGAQGCSGDTMKSYRSTFRVLEEFVDSSGDASFAEMEMGRLSHALVTSFMSWLKDCRNNSPATIALRLAAIRSFLRFCAARDAIWSHLRDSVAAIPAPKVPDKGVQSLSAGAIAAILAQPDASVPRGLRDLAFMAVMYSAGARMGEMLSLRICDIGTGDGVVSLWLTGKGNKRRPVPIDDEAAQHLLQYLESFHPNACRCSEDLLFYTVIHGQRCPMSDDCARRFIKKHSDAAREVCGDVPKSMHSHLFRHSRALHLYQAGNDLITVRDFLGHASIATTDI
jgi:site-specific recombinase XerD